MKLFTSTRFIPLVAAIATFTCGNFANAQMPQCLGSGGFVYIQNGNNIYNFDPTLPASATNPTINTIVLPGGSGGLAVSRNINSTTAPSPTFYTTVNNNYYYYDGAAWINTGHSVGNAAAVNIGAGGGFLYNLVGGSGQVYKYDGTGPGTLLTTVAGFNGGGPYDLVGDCAGNWYIINPNTSSGQYLRKYSPTGVLLQTYTLTNAPNSSAGGGFAIVGSTVFYHNNTTFQVGTIVGNNITFTAQTSPNPSGADYGSCELGATNSITASIDTGYYCGTGPGVPVTAFGQGPFVWTVLSGPATVTNVNATTVSISAPSGISRIELRGQDTTTVTSTLCPNSSTRDTVVLIVPSGVADAGVSDTIFGCALYVDTLQGSFNGFPSYLNFNYSWAPATSILSGGNTLTPIAIPSGPTRYYLTVSTSPAQGGCTFTDSVDKAVKDVSVTADFNFDVRYGCGTDTVDFTNASFDNKFNYWNFGDNSPGDTARNPIHRYNRQAIFNAYLLVTNGICRDSITKPVDLLHPLDAEFTVSEDSVCAQLPITFTSTSITTTRLGIDPTYLWIYDDGNTDTGAVVTHTFLNSGVYNVKLVVKDFVPCTDTQNMIIVVDSTPYVRFSLSDSVLCEGQAVRFVADYLNIGNRGIQWDFGDGLVEDGPDVILHPYDTAGQYIVKLTSFYRVCPDIFTTDTITINTFPSINLGPDTVLCPYGQPIVLADLNGGVANPLASYTWNTGDTTGYIIARDQGVYSATITLNGCSSTDTINVLKDCYLDIPNAFTPNGDGDNDYFIPRQLLSRSVTSFTMSVFNRWGQKVFESKNLDGRGWDGKFNGAMQPAGVYIYTVEVGFRNSTGEKYTGNVTLLR